MTGARGSPLVRFVAFALLAIVVPATILAVLGYHSLRQWHRSADELFHEQSRSMAVMIAEKVDLALRHAEYEIMRYLVEHRGEILTRERLLDEVWGYERFPTTRTVDTHVLRLRQKFERDPERPEHILTVHGQGYRFAG